MKYLFFLASLSLLFLSARTEQKVDKSKVYTSLLEALKEPEKVYRLNLSHQNLSTIPTEIRQLEQLEMLWLSDNKLKAIPDEIGNLSNLQALAILVAL